MGILRARMPALRAAFAGGSLPWESPRGGLSVQAPGVTTAPVIAGTNAVGSTLTCTPGVYTGAPAPTVTRQWKRAGVAIGGATALTYVQVTADAGAALTCVETATNAVNSTTSTSNTITTKPYNTALPSIDNTLYAGGSIQMTDAVWAGSTSQVRDVLVNGVVVVDDASEATVEAYVLLLAQEGLSCVVRSIATGPGGTTSADSAGVTIWSPAAGTGAHWWRGDDVAWVAGSPDKLTTFNAKLGAITLTQATAGLKPEYLATLAALGQPGGKFVKANSHEMAATGLSVAAPWTIVLGFAHTSLADNEIIIGGTAGSDWYFRYRTTSGGLWGFVGGGAGEALTSGVTPATATPYYAVIVLNGTSSKIRINGVSRYAGATDLGASTLTAVRMSRSTSFDLPFDGEAGEVVVIPGDLTADAAELARYEGYMAARYT